MKQYLIKISSVSDEELNKCLSLMTDERKKYINSVSNPKRRLESIAGEWLMKKAAADYLSLPAEKIIIDRTEKGKPFIKGEKVHVSLSHSGDYVAAAIDKSPVGIDIEILKPIDLKVAKKVLNDSDRGFFEKGDRLLNFYKIWTAKEAYFKMTGTGIIDMKGISYNEIHTSHTFEKGLIITTVN